MAGKKIGLSLIGYGVIGESHLAVMEQLEKENLIEITGVAEPDKNRQSALKAAKPNIPIFGDAKDAIAHPNTDAVIIATPDDAHRLPCITAAKHKKHVLVEKPLATNLADCQAIIAACQTNNVKLTVGHVLRFSDDYRYAAKQVENNELGTIASVFARRTNPITFQPTRMKGRVSVIGFLGVHDFDILHYILQSEPKRIYCEPSGLDLGFGTVDEAFVTIAFENGVSACVQVGWLLPSSHPTGFEFGIHITGDKGVCNLNYRNAVAELFSANKNEIPMFTLNHALYEQDKSFVKCIINNTAPLVSGADGMQAVKMVLLAEESAQKHLPVEFC